MHNFLKELRQKVSIGLVGGSDLAKMQEQMGKTGISLPSFLFSFPLRSSSFSLFHTKMRKREEEVNLVLCEGEERRKGRAQ
jgi:hypothetical protein